MASGQHSKWLLDRPWPIHGGFLCCPHGKPKVYLVQFHDASWTFRFGAAVNAAEAETAAGPRRHEPSTLRPERHPGNEGSINHGMLGLQDWPTQSPAGGSPLFCVSLLRGCKYSTSPLSVHEMSAVQQKEKTIRNSPSPRAFRRERGTAVCLTQLPDVTASHLLHRACPQPHGK